MLHSSDGKSLSATVGIPNEGIDVPFSAVETLSTGLVKWSADADLYVLVLVSFCLSKVFLTSPLKSLFPACRYFGVHCNVLGPLAIPSNVLGKSTRVL